jgi:hypothetical protein
MAILPAHLIRSKTRSRTLRWVSLALATGTILALGSAATPVGRAHRGATAAAAPPASRVATPPARPRKYSLPRKAIWVSNEAQLRRALARNRSRDIVLRNGFYGGSKPYLNPGGDRLYAQALGKAVLGAGLSMGGRVGPGGGLVRGVAFDVSDPARTLDNSIIHVWGTGTNTRILDVTVDGHLSVAAGIEARQVEGLVIQRVIARSFKSYGVFVDTNVRDQVVARPPLLEDITAAYVRWSPPLSSNGTAEACLWVGNTAVVRRVRLSSCAWEGLWVGTAATNALFEDIRVLNEGIGVYLEHFVHSSTFRRLQIGPNVYRGLTCEWADPVWGSQPACVNNVIEQSRFETQGVGVYLDEGTTNTTVRTSTFIGQCWAAIGNFKGIGNLSDTSGNDYSKLRAGAVAVSTSHLSAAARCAQSTQG